MASGGKKKSGLAGGYDWLEAVVTAVVLFALCFAFVGRMVQVHGISMEPTLYEGERLFITRLGGYEQGDIVVSAKPNQYDELLIKRVIAVEGQQVDIDFEAGTVSVDGQVLEEPYTKEPTRLSYDVVFPVTVPKGHVFLMGDNRNHSLDSRSTEVGMTDVRYLAGKVLRFGS